MTSQDSVVICDITVLISVLLLTAFYGTVNSQTSDEAGKFFF
jgi:hypothetical protein